MINNSKVLAIIPARSGSKGLPGKNIKPFCGRPLIHWTIEQALASKYIDHTMVSTDCPDIRDTVNELGEFACFLRPPRLASDDASMVDVVLDAINRVSSFDYVIVLQPTSPLRTTVHIDAAIKLCLDENAGSCVSVCEVKKSPYWMYSISGSHMLRPLLEEKNIPCRQQLPKCYVLNGAVYVLNINKFIKQKKFIDENTKAYIMHEDDSVDIDVLSDFRFAENVFEQKNKV